MKTVKRMSIIVVGLLVLPVVLLWLILAQPSCARSQPSPISLDAARLKEHVLTLSEKNHPRDCSHPGNLNLCARYISSHFEQAGARVSFQEFSVAGNSYRNVRGLFGPHTGTRLVVGAHYDSCGSDNPGADDNASGVAGLIELAYLLGQAECERTVEVVAYPLEEPPFYKTGQMGSARHARLLRQQNIEVRAMIALEMIGYFRDRIGSQKFPMRILWLFYPTRGNFVAVVGSLGQRKLIGTVRKHMRGTTDLPVHSLSAPRFVPGVDFSDHLNYWDQGYAAVMITDTAFYRNPNYHAPADTPDTLDYERMAKVVIGVYETVKRLATDF